MAVAHRGKGGLQPSVLRLASYVSPTFPRMASAGPVAACPPLSSCLEDVVVEATLSSSSTSLSSSIFTRKLATNFYIQRAVPAASYITPRVAARKESHHSSLLCIPCWAPLTPARHRRPRSRRCRRRSCAPSTSRRRRRTSTPLPHTAARSTCSEQLHGVRKHEMSLHVPQGCGGPKGTALGPKMEALRCILFGGCQISWGGASSAAMCGPPIAHRPLQARTAAGTPATKEIACGERTHRRPRKSGKCWVLSDGDASLTQRGPP